MLLSPRRFLLALSLLLGILVPFVVALQPKTKRTQISVWIEQLGDNDFKVRENASRQLWQAGAAAESSLEKAAKNPDPEVARRARELLDKFRWGIYPDTPADIVALIRAYQSSEGNPRLDVLQKLLDSGEPGLHAVRKIASAEKDEDQRKMLGDLVANKLPSDFFLAVTEGKYEQFERLLELGHENKFVGHTPYAAYWLLRGKLPERIALFRARLSEHPEDNWLAQALTYLHRANGDLIAARKAAEKCNRLDLLEGILYELGDWKALAAKGTLHFAGADNPAEKWAYRAAFARLAGEKKEFEDAVRELRACGQGKADRDLLQFVAAKGLLLNDRPADGLELLRSLPKHRDVLFDILCARLDFAGALDLAVKEVSTDKEVPRLDLARARLLYWLGEKEGEALFDRYSKRIKDGVDPQYVELLLKEELRAGLKDRAFAHAAKALTVAPPKNRNDLNSNALAQLYLPQLFGQQASIAEVWWFVLRRQFEDESPAAVLVRLRNLMEGRIAAKDVRAWIETDQARHAASPRIENPTEKLQAKRAALAEGAILAGLDELASSLLRESDSHEALLRLGDLFAAKKRWDKAASCYRQAWTKRIKRDTDLERSQALVGEQAHNPLPLYLAGDALVRAGQKKEGQKLIEQAHWVPFAEAEVRDTFLRTLTERGHKEAARRETELMLRMSEPNSNESAAASRRLALTAWARKDYLRAAEGLEKAIMRCFNPYISFVDNAAYVNAPAQLHQLRASASLAAGKLDEALKHMGLALTHSPGFVELAIALVPELEGRGHKKEATDLFHRCYETCEKVCRNYPSCSWAHNSVAWLCACCRRNLDRALRHAEKAVELAPTHAGYLDTLAEVHFQRGDKEKAIALQKRAIELNPKKVYFQKQLKRLEAGDPSAERPSEVDD